MKTSTFSKVLPYLLAVALCVAAWFIRGCTYDCPEPVINNDTSATSTPAPALIDTAKPKPVYIHTDTSGVTDRYKQTIEGLRSELEQTRMEYEQKLLDMMLDYYAEVDYDTTLSNDTIQTRASCRVHLNRMDWLAIRSDLLIPISQQTITNTTIIDGRRVRWLLGAGVSYNVGQPLPFGLHVGIGVVSKKHFAMTITGDPFRQSVAGTVYYGFHRK